jgi:hypothetical protein
MSLTNQELREILQATREAMRRRGLASLDDHIVSGLSPEGAEPFDDVIRYLKTLADHARFSSQGEYGRTMQRLNRYSKTEDGRAIEGIDLAMTGGDTDRYHIDQLNLEGAPEELNETARELVEIVDAIFHEVRGSDEVD